MLLSTARQYDGREYHDQRDDALRNDAVQAPHLQDRVFHVGKIKRIAKSRHRRRQGPVSLTQQCQQTDQQVSGDPDRGHWHTIDRGIRTVVDDSAIPVRINVAWLEFIGVVHLERQRRHHGS